MNRKQEPYEVRYRKRILPLVVTTCIGITVYIIMVYTLYRNGLPNIFELIKTLNLQVFIVALAIRALIPLIHSMQLYLCVKALNISIPYRTVYRGTAASIASEYIIPFGGMAEVYKVAFMFREGVKLNLAAQAVFLHRFVISLSILIASLVIANFVYLNSMFVTLLLCVSIGITIMNLLGFVLLRNRSVGKVLNRFARGILFKILHIELSTLENDLNSMKVKFIPSFLALAIFIALLERIAIALCGYAIVRSLGIYTMNIFLCMLIFDLIQIILWILPVITPGGLGVLESIQLIALHSVTIAKFNSLIPTLPIINRFVMLLCEGPQYAISFSSDVFVTIEKLRHRSRH